MSIELVINKLNKYDVTPDPNIAKNSSSKIAQVAASQQITKKIDPLSVSKTSIAQKLEQSTQTYSMGSLFLSFIPGTLYGASRWIHAAAMTYPQMPHTGVVAPIFALGVWGSVNGKLSASIYNKIETIDPSYSQNKGVISGAVTTLLMGSTSGFRLVTSEAMTKIMQTSSPTDPFSEKIKNGFNTTYSELRAAKPRLYLNAAFRFTPMYFAEQIGSGLGGDLLEKYTAMKKLLAHTVSSATVGLFTGVMDWYLLNLPPRALPYVVSRNAISILSVKLPGLLSDSSSFPSLHLSYPSNDEENRIKDMIDAS